MKSPLSSDRLQKCLAALRGAGEQGITPIELNNQCGSTRATSDVSELRQHGIPIEKNYVGITANKRRLFRYKLACTPDEAEIAWAGAYNRVSAASE
jgi:hypothetical protein